MKNLVNYFKRNIYFMISIITVFLAAVFAITIFLVYDFSTQENETTVGSVFLGGVDDSQYQQVLSSEVNEYLDVLNFDIKYQGVSVNLPSTLFTPNIDVTISEIKQNSQNKVVFTIEASHQGEILNHIDSMFTQNYLNLIDSEKLFNALISDLGDMVLIKDYQLEDYFVDSAFNQSLYTDVVAGVNASDVTKILNQMDTIVIKPHSRFSILNELENYDLTNEQLSVLATGMLKVLTNTHMNGFVFHTYPEEPIWATLGYNVRVLKVNGYDFTFYNANDFEYHIELSQFLLNTISFSLKGVPQVFDYEVNIVKQATVPVENIYIDNDTLNAFTPGVVEITTETETRYELLIEAGTEGGVYTIYRTVTNADGHSIIEKLYDLYMPSQSNIYELNIVEIGGA